MELADYIGDINADLTVGADVTQADVARGQRRPPAIAALIPVGAGFLVTPEEAENLGLGTSQTE